GAEGRTPTRAAGRRSIVSSRSARYPTISPQLTSLAWRYSGHRGCVAGWIRMIHASRPHGERLFVPQVPSIRSRRSVSCKRRRLRRSFEQQFGRAPNPREEAALVDHAIDEEVLYRRALELGLDRGNRVVRQRLVATMRLVADDVAKDDESLYREALRLLLDRT